MSRALITDQSLFEDIDVFLQHHQSSSEKSCLLTVEKFALTSNNITYALVGNVIGYWSFFPVAKERYGIIPAWGFARVSSGGIRGRRCFGFLPMAESFNCVPTHPTDRGFMDGAAHRLPLPQVYNYYNLVPPQNAPDQKGEAYEMIFRPLFTTAFLLNQMLLDDPAFRADTIVITSASSKTAMALSHLLSRHTSKCLVGVTSPSNVAFVENLGHYETTMTYDNFHKLDIKDNFVTIDFAGNTKWLKSLLEQRPQKALRCVQVGLTQHEDYNPAQRLDKRAGFFFAPDYVTKYQQLWGGRQYHERLESSWQGFIRDIPGALTVKTINSIDHFRDVYRSFKTGQIDPSCGFIVDMVNFKW